MTPCRLEFFLQHIRKLVGAPEGDGATDRQLLRRFARQHDESAFVALVARHGPLVLGMCRRVLQNDDDASDAFQATFFVLAQKAASIRWRESVGSWLYEVALRVASKARAANFRRQRVTSEAVMPLDPFSAAASRELQSLVDEELRRLPDKYRQPLVLCCLEDASRSEAARQLGWKEGTVAGRLARGRAMLQKRLMQRGVTLSATSLAAVLTVNAAAAPVSVALMDTTVRAAQVVIAGGPAGAISGSVAALVEGMVKEMLVSKIKVVAAVFLSVCVLGMVAAVFAHQTLAEPETQAVAKAVADDEQEPKRVNPVVLGPGEFQADHLRAQVRQLLVVVQDNVPKVGVLVPATQAGGGPWKVEFVDATRVPAQALLAEISVPQRMVIVSAAFPYRAQLERYRQALRLRSIQELANQPELLPKFLTLQVRRRTLNQEGQVLQAWSELNLENDYKPILAVAAATEAEADEIKKVVFPGLVMTRLRLAQGDYPPLRLQTLQKTIRFLQERGKDAQTKELVVPDQCLVRFLDVTVEPGKTYEYQVQIRLANPNHGQKELVAYPALAEPKVLTGQWEPEKPISMTVPADR